MLKELFKTLAFHRVNTTRKPIRGVQPDWASPSDRMNRTRHYYFPEIEVYYDVEAAVFVCWNGKDWKQHTELPECHRWFNLFIGHKVSLEPGRDAPWKFHIIYKLKFPKDKWKNCPALHPAHPGPDHKRTADHYSWH